MIIVRLLSPGPWLVGTTKVYSGVGADIVMESITLRTPQLPRHLVRRAKRGCEGRGGILPLSDRWSLANAVRKVEFKLLQSAHPAGTRFLRLNAQKRRSARLFCHLSPAKAYLDKDFHAFGTLGDEPEW